MREIKFRAWDSENNCKKLSVGTIELFDDMLAFRFEHFEQDTENIVFEQFTGLHDKNGREIYEGDIVLWCGVECEIRYREEIAAFERFSPQGPAVLTNRHEHLMTVIGNIHENQELLK